MVLWYIHWYSQWCIQWYSQYYSQCYCQWHSQCYSQWYSQWYCQCYCECYSQTGRGVTNGQKGKAGRVEGGDVSDDKGKYWNKSGRLDVSVTDNLCVPKVYT